ncbi:hypothetical protein Nepgr_005993 [Nepenthes gracilis]|uniref:Uncharacterized protein n=1 Tax=Nepenthes gracilis TaxID=150966 RepID=A0AAD3XGX8_NEPGR|nr:hypothetical protein Nepgr_005993 [Nepenthes gracilis]
MRIWCPNFDKEDGLETVLEVPVPDEMFGNAGSGATNSNAALRWKNMRSWVKARSGDNKWSLSNSSSSNSVNEFMLLLKLIGSPLVPFQVHLDMKLAPSHPIKDSTIESSTAKYILQQYIAAIGGVSALNSVNSMYAVGQVKIVSSDIHQSSQSVIDAQKNCEMGGFVVWQKNPDLWCLELVVSGCKVTAGCDGKVAWSQSSSQPPQASKGPPRPLRRFLQGLDPRSAACLFCEAVCVGEKTVNNEDCFVLKRETSSDMLKAQSAAHTEVMHHTVWGYFSQRTGLLIQFEDTKLVKLMQVAGKCSKTVFWETTLETMIEDYRYVDGINIAHCGSTNATLYRYGGAYNHKGRIEETWRIEEVDFNICGLSTDCFLPPSELNI